MNKMYFQTHEKEIAMVKTKTSIQCVFIFFENHIDGIIKVYSWIKNQLWSHLFIFASVISDWGDDPPKNIAENDVKEHTAYTFS